MDLCDHGEGEFRLSGGSHNELLKCSLPIFILLAVILRSE
jgi:hypothetical protein